MRLLLSGNTAIELPDLPDLRLSLHKSEQIRAQIAADVEYDIRTGRAVFTTGKPTQHLTRMLSARTVTMPTMKVEQVK